MDTTPRKLHFHVHAFVHQPILTFPLPKLLFESWRNKSAGQQEQDLLTATAPALGKCCSADHWAVVLQVGGRVWCLQAGPGVPAAPPWVSTAGVCSVSCCVGGTPIGVSIPLLQGFQKSHLSQHCSISNNLMIQLDDSFLFC